MFGLLEVAKFTVDWAKPSPLLDVITSVDVKEGDADDHNPLAGSDSPSIGRARLYRLEGGIFPECRSNYHYQSRNIFLLELF